MINIMPNVSKLVSDKGKLVKVTKDNIIHLVDYALKSKTRLSNIMINN